MLPTSMRSTIFEVLEDHARRAPAALAIAASSVNNLTFAHLVRIIQEIGCQLRAAGIGNASRVGVALPRGPEAALVSIAVCCTAILVPLNPTLAAEELQAELEWLRLDALIVLRDSTDSALTDAASRGCGLFTIAPIAGQVPDVTLRQERAVGNAKDQSSMSAASWAALFKTSGTTGASKRVPVTHGNLLAMAAKMERWLKLTPADRSACIMPIHYNAGFKATLLAPLLVGCSVALPASTAPRDTLQWMGELRPTWLTAAPAFLQSLVEKLGSESKDRLASAIGSLRFVLSTASYCPPATAANLEEILRRPVVEFYGLCEAGMMTAPMLPPARAKPGTVGRIPRGELAIRNGEGRFLPADQVGNVVVRGPSVTPGYIVDDIDSVPSGLEDGWLLTGDLGSVDEDGLLTIVGREKEIINRGGEKVSPYLVEKALLCHTAVREAAVFVVPHPRLGENVAAAVVLQSGASASSSELLEFIYDRLAPSERPRRIHVVENLPVGATGKLQRSQLSKMFADRESHEEMPSAPLEMVIAEIWQRLLKRSDIGMDDDWFELGGDSLLGTEMLLELGEVTRHAIAPSDLRAELTVRHLVRVLARQVAVRNEVMTQARSGRGTPLFLWHGDYEGWGLYAFRLVALLKGDGPVYLLHSILDPTAGIETIEEMVQRQLPHISAAAPTGPLRLAGYCHGGHAALEACARLEGAGRTIETIVLIDSLSINARPLVRFAARLISIAGRVPGPLGSKTRRHGLPGLWVVVQLLQGDRTTAQRVFRKLRSGSVGTWIGSQAAAYYRAMSRFIPPRVRADIVCLLSEERTDHWGCAIGPWRRLATCVRSAPVPGQHHTVASRHFAELAAGLSEALSGGEADAGGMQRDASAGFSGSRRIAAAPWSWGDRAR